MTAPTRIIIAGVGIDAIDLPGAASAILARAASISAPAYVVTPNAQHVCNLQDDAEFRDIYHRAWLSVADGVPLVWASRLLGQRLPGRVNGTDLFVELCTQAGQRGLRVFLLGGRPGAADAALAILRLRAPTLEAAVHCPPVGFEGDPEEEEACERAVLAFQPHILFVGLGSPKQERWISRRAAALAVPVAIGIGVSFELVSGMVPRAPLWMQRSGLEWFFRLLVEPRRLWRRYVIGNPRFLWLVLRQRLARRSAAATADGVAAAEECFGAASPSAGLTADGPMASHSAPPPEAS